MSQIKGNTVKSESRDFAIQIAAPVYNEGDSVLTLYRSLIQSNIQFDELRFVYDIDTDTSLPFIADLAKTDTRVKADKNLYGKGVVNALRWIFSKAVKGPLIVVMADNSDKLSIIPEMINMWKDGSVVVSPSRYMKGGKLHGGPVFKGFLSRISGVFLSLLGFPTSDPTNNYKLYDGEWVSKQNIESEGGFEVALELTGKAYFQGNKITQLPTEWWDRTQGESKFKMWKWIPKYLRWYLPLVVHRFIGRKIVKSA